MKGILFTETMFKSNIAEIKTETRRLILPKHLAGFTGEEWQKEFLCNAHAPYKKGETVYLKEPYYKLENGMFVIYKYDCDEQLRSIAAWKNKMFMPEVDARHYIEILDVCIEKLNDISEDSACAEGLHFSDLFDEWGGVEPHDTVKGHYRWFKNPINAYKSLWNYINVKRAHKKKKCPWSSNPWVWVIKYKLLKK